MPMERGIHQRLNNSGLRQASNTRCGGESNIRVTMISRPDCLPQRIGTGIGRLPALRSRQPTSSFFPLDAAGFFHLISQFAKLRDVALYV